MKMKTFFLTFVLIIISLPKNAQAASPKLEGSFVDWNVFSIAAGNDKICWALSKPLSKSPKSVNHGDVYFMVSSWKSGSAKEQPSLYAGYELKTNRTPIVRIKNKKFKMFASNNEGFIENNADERALVSSMRSGATMQVEAVSSRGTKVNYSFSLKGITAALKKARTVCR